MIRMTLPTSSSVLAELSAHPSRDTWASAVRECALAAYVQGAPALRLTTPSPALQADSVTPYGDLLELLAREPDKDTERWALSSLLALSLVDDARRADAADALTWLAANTSLDALSLLDEALGADAAPLWQRLGHIARAPAEFSLNRGAALTAAAALAASRAPAAGREVRELRSRSTDPLLLSVLSQSAEPAEGGSTLLGELSTPPRHAVWTVVLGLTGILAIIWLFRLLGRFALAVRRPAEVRVTARGLELEHRTEMLGRVLRDRELLVPLSNLGRVTREVRYARAGLYAGLFALAVGLYAGVGLFVDGVRVPGTSPSLLGMALALVVLGLGIDFGLSSLSDSVKGKCRLVVEPLKGRKLCIGALDPRTADAMLERLAEQTKA